MGEQYSADISSIFRHICYWDDDIWFDKLRHNVIAILFTEPLPDRRHVCQPHAEYGWLHWIHRINELYQAKQDLWIHRLIRFDPPHSWSLIRSGYIWSYRRILPPR
jgi:hypothetical protein